MVVVFSAIACGRLANATLRGECTLVWNAVLAMLAFPSSIAWWLALSAVALALSSFNIELAPAFIFDRIGSVGFVGSGICSGSFCYLGYCARWQTAAGSRRRSHFFGGTGRGWRHTRHPLLIAGYFCIEAVLETWDGEVVTNFRVATWMFFLFSRLLPLTAIIAAIYQLIRHRSVQHAVEVALAV
ncbi:MAG TPA: hypothetical protein VHK90_03155 [Thermoanaerobaculia bacterium]|nr:hypothetical protein [Thermoanaerobaculia bacterium]